MKLTVIKVQRRDREAHTLVACAAHAPQARDLAEGYRQSYPDTVYEEWTTYGECPVQYGDHQEES